MNHQINQRELSMLLCASKTLSNPALVEKYKLHLIRLLAFQEGAVAHHEGPRRVDCYYMPSYYVYIYYYILTIISYHYI